MAGLVLLSMISAGLRRDAYIPKQVFDKWLRQKGKDVSRSVIIIGLIALAALVAGFLMFGGANMGP